MTRSVQQLDELLEVKLFYIENDVISVVYTLRNKTPEELKKSFLGDSNCNKLYINSTQEGIDLYKSKDFRFFGIQHTDQKKELVTGRELLLWTKAKAKEYISQVIEKKTKEMKAWDMFLNNLVHKLPLFNAAIKKEIEGFVARSRKTWCVGSTWQETPWKLGIIASPEPIKIGANFSKMVEFKFPFLGTHMHHISRYALITYHPEKDIILIGESSDWTSFIGMLRECIGCSFN